MRCRGMFNGEIMVSFMTSFVKDECKEELQDEVMLALLEVKSEPLINDTTGDVDKEDQCLYDGISDLTIHNQFAASVKEEFTATTSSIIGQHYECTSALQSCSSDWLPAIITPQSTPPLPAKQRKSLLLHCNISKKRLRGFGTLITPPTRFVVGWCDSRRAKAILKFLESFANISKRSKYSRCGNYSSACSGPRILICEECSRQFCGLHDRYLKICLHYKTCHSKNCNKLIGQKLSKHYSTYLLMISAWQWDTYETMNYPRDGSDFNEAE